MDLYIHKNFIFGNENSQNIKDYQFFSVAEVNFFANFLFNIYAGSGLFCGANKLSNRTFRVANRGLATQYNLKHYHYYLSGNSNCDSTCKNKIICSNFLILKQKETCAEIFHYLIQEEKLVFFAFSPIHDDGKFPLFNLPPLVHRLQSNKNYLLSFRDFKYFNLICRHMNIQSSRIFFDFVQKNLKIANLSFLDLEDRPKLNYFINFIVYIFTLCKEQSFNYSSLTDEELKKIYLNYCLYLENNH